LKFQFFKYSNSVSFALSCIKITNVSVELQTWIGCVMKLVTVFTKQAWLLDAHMKYDPRDFFVYKLFFFK